MPMIAVELYKKNLPKIFQKYKIKIKAEEKKPTVIKICNANKERSLKMRENSSVSEIWE